jgi:hypothetical protein
LEELVRYCEDEGIRVLVGCVSNAHHTAWGSTNCNGRGEALVVFLNSSNLQIFNRGNESTFCNSVRQEVIDITVGSYELMDSIVDWEVSLEPSLSDHRHILFTLQGSVPVLLTRNPRGTKWDSFREDLRERLEGGPEMSMEDEEGLGLAGRWIQQALIQAYEGNCPQRPIRKGKKSLKWTAELQRLRREVRRLFNKCRANNDTHSWELYRETQRRYRKEVRKASKETWRTFCSSMRDLPRSARLHKALSRGPQIKLGSLVAPTGERTRSERETLDLLLATHFPDSVRLTGEAMPAAACHTKRDDWQLAARIVTYHRVLWAINSFAPYKSPGMDGIFPALLQKGQEILIPYLIRIFRACLATGYVPSMWCQVKVVFIPKPGRNSHCGPKDFRPISLTSFLLKTLERLVDRYLRDEVLALKPLHPNQHAYQAGKSVETALHQPVVRVEKALDQQEVVLGAFLDIEGAFDNTSYDSMCAALSRHGAEHTIVQWSELPWRVAELLRRSAAIPGVLQYPRDARRVACCHHCCGALS